MGDPRKQAWPTVAIFATVLLAISFSANIAASLHYGRLAQPPSYDDISYLSDALQRFLFDPGRGLSSVISSFLANPPHAPLSTLTALSGFWLFGPWTVAPYLANAWILAVFVLTIAAVSRKIEDTVQRVLFITLFLFAPVAHAMVNEFRPDMAAGLLFGIALYAICTVDLSSTAVSRRLWLGVLAALATIAKPSAMIVTIPFLGLAGCSAIFLNARKPGQSLLQAVKQASPAIAVYAGIITLFLVVWGKTTYAYIYQALISNADIWSTPGSPIFHGIYHSFGAGGTKALGPFLVGPFICLWDAIILFRDRRSNPGAAGILTVYSLLVLLYAGMAMSNEKTVFQGSLFYLPLIICTAHALARRIRAANGAGRVMPTRAILGICVCLLVFFAPFASSYTKAQQDRLQISRLLDDVTLRIAQTRSTASEACRRKSYTIVTTNPDPLSPNLIAYQAALQGIELRESSTFFARDLAVAEGALSQADFVFTPDANAPILSRRLPGAAFVDALNARLASDPDWTMEKIGEFSGYPMFLAIRKCENSLGPG